jgi:hypothetical protein
LGSELGIAGLQRHHPGNDRTICSEAGKGFGLRRQQGDQKSPSHVSIRQEEEMDSANIPIGAIQGILGHENRATTEVNCAGAHLIYLHSIGNAEREAVAFLEKQESFHTRNQTMERVRGCKLLKRLVTRAGLEPATLFLKGTTSGFHNLLRFNKLLKPNKIQFSGFAHFG